MSRCSRRRLIIYILQVRCLVQCSQISLINGYRARRNKFGQLEPDAQEDVLQKSLGFGEYEHAPKVESRE